MKIISGLAGLAVSLLLASGASAFDANKARALFIEGKYKDAITVLEPFVKGNPADEAARVLLAEVLEKSNRMDDALAVWEQVLVVCRDEDNLNKARRGVSRLRRIKLDQANEDLTQLKTPADEFKIPMPEIDWKGLEIIEDASLNPPILPPPFDVGVPPFDHETKHFTVYSHNKKLSEVVGDRAELYLEWINKRLFNGRSWAVRFPIFVYRDLAEFEASRGFGHGTTFRDQHGIGKTWMIVMFQLSPDEGKQNLIYKYSIESILTHELTHAVLNEFFGGTRTPQWLHEAVAGRFELTRKHYLEAARLARFVVAGEYFRMRDLFEQVGYPARIELFYEQSAVVVLYLFETGPEAMHAFLTELAQGRDHDHACAAALGIPVEGAVEEFERRWVEWMKIRYLIDLDRSADGTESKDAAVSMNKVLAPWVNETETVALISGWRDVELNNLDGFMGVGKSKSNWSASGGSLKCTGGTDGGSSVLGIRMNEIAPVALTMDVTMTGGSGDNLFGFAQLDSGLHDAQGEVLTRLGTGKSQTVTLLWTDDLALYMDGKCVARYPAFQIKGNVSDIDFPLGIVTYGPVEIQNIKIGAIRSFSDKPVVWEEKKDEGNKENKDQGGERRRSRRDRSKPSAPSGPSG